MQALINERQRRKRGKALPLQAAEEYHGGAVFWSPRKVKEARDRQLQQGLEEEQQQLQKAEVARLREEQRQEKLQAVQQRRVAKAAARLIRQKEKAREAADRASRQAARKAQQRLQQAQKTTQKGKRRSLKAPIKAPQKKRPIARPRGGAQPHEAHEAPPTSTSRGGRAIRTPVRFL
jgi:hypothetical protein